jgi:S-adenosyl-L-methionine hydrolase (adenosine-forming)
MLDDKETVLKLITLLTDFGTRDGYPGIMKGVIWKIAPDVQIADLSHEVPPQNVMDGALTLSRSVPYFPYGTVFIAVVDPGVGTQRRPIAARIGEQYFVGPDNGLFSFVLQQARQSNAPVEIVHLDQPRFWLEQVSNVFHGRDVFAPAGAHLSRGVPLSDMGTPLRDPILIDLPAPERIPGGWRGQVIHVDSFGNLATNLGRDHLPSGQAVVQIAGQQLRGLAQAFGDGAPGNLVTLIDSDGKLSIAVVNGSAAKRLNVGSGEPVELTAP